MNHYFLVAKKEGLKTDLGFIPYKFKLLGDAARVAASFNDPSIIVCSSKAGWKQVYPKQIEGGIF